MRSRISAAAFSVNVTATMRSGSTPRSSSSRYTSTSFRVLPVPALANTTVFFSRTIKPAKPPEVALETILIIGGIWLQTAVPDFFEKEIDAAANFVEQFLIDRAGNDGTARRAQQQVPPLDAHTGVGAEGTNGEPCINRNLKRVFQLFRRVAGCSRIFEIVDSDRVDAGAGAMNRDMIGPAGDQRRTQHSRGQRCIEIFRLRLEAIGCIADRKYDVFVQDRQQLLAPDLPQ